MPQSQACGRQRDRTASVMALDYRADLLDYPLKVE
jgi:hypothetical protein